MCLTHTEMAEVNLARIIIGRRDRRSPHFQPSLARLWRLDHQHRRRYATQIMTASDDGDHDGCDPAEPRARAEAIDWLSLHTLDGDELGRARLARLRQGTFPRRAEETAA